MGAAENVEPVGEAPWAALRRDLGGFFSRRIADRHLAEDLVQETLLRVHARMDELADGERLTAWVHRIAGNVLIDERRRGGRPTEKGPGVDGAEEPAARESPDAPLNAVAGGWAQAMIAQLSDVDREVLELSEVQELPQREIARRLGLTLTAVKSRVQRGRERLRVLLLACCHLEFDARGNVVDYERRDTCRGCADC